MVSAGRRVAAALAARVKRLAEAARVEVESAARQLAATCDVPVDQVGG